MHKKALSMDINFTITVNMDISHLISNSVSEDAIVTLIADLIENAIIATKECDKKNINLTLNTENNLYSISIYDSGIPFEPYTIVNVGKKRASTHLDTGGSGIGLMNTFDFLRKINASFIIDETVENDFFTKKVSIIFDQLNQFQIYSHRPEIMELAINHRDIRIN